MTITGALQRRPPEAVGCEESWLQTLELKMWNWKKKSFERKNPKSPKHESYRKLKQHMESGYTFGKQLLLLAKKKKVWSGTMVNATTATHGKSFSINITLKSRRATLVREVRAQWDNKGPVLHRPLHYGFEACVMTATCHEME